MQMLSSASLRYYELTQSLRKMHWMHVFTMHSIMPPIVLPVYDLEQICKAKICQIMGAAIYCLSHTYTRTLQGLCQEAMSC